MLDLRARAPFVAAVSLVFLLPTSALLAQDTGAECTLTFNAGWSAQTHPTDFPPNPHFSPLIGAAHNGDIIFWEGGMQSSPGIQAVAEFGTTNTFRSEIEDEIVFGTAASVIAGGPVGTSPGVATADFSLELSHPLVSVVTMIAPSPDWFVGVHGLPLFEDGQWREQVVMELPAYDAGTDSGATFQSQDLPTVPHEPIFEITTAPFTGGTSMGTFTFDCASDLLFFDGFESGNVAVWASAVP